jgi:uncharacterized protein YdaU (DUF1376 family)
VNDFPDFIAVNGEAHHRLTRHLDLTELGLLQTVLLHYWQDRQPLPSSDRAMAATARIRVGVWRRHKAKIAPFFDQTPDGWVPSALTLEFQRPGEEIDDLNASLLGGA